MFNEKYLPFSGNIYKSHFGKFFNHSPLTFILKFLKWRSYFKNLNNLSTAKIIH